MAQFQLAQVNVAHLAFPRTDPRFKSFTDQLDHVNALAEASPGFVWRYLDAYDGSDGVFTTQHLVNMSVWASLEELKEYVYRSDHRLVMQDRKQWFVPTETAHFAMWWTESGTTPTIEEAKRRLDHLDTHGETEFAFTYRKPFPAPNAACVP